MMILFSLIQQRKNDYEELMREFEFRKFKSPAGWMLVLNYYRIVSSLFKSSTLLFKSILRNNER